MPKLLVTINRPKSTKNAPPTIEITLRYFDIFLTKVAAWPIPTAKAKNGMAKPIEKTKSKRPPVTTVALDAANNKIEPKTGPTHGVQPKPKAAPKTSELEALPRSKIAGILNLFSSLKLEIFKIFIMNNPNTITNTPPSLANQS